MRTMLQYALALIWLASGTQASALTLAETGQLHEHPDWLTLMHYQPNRYADGYTSQADDDDYFLSEHGKHSPSAELQATLAAITKPGGDNDHASCRFPARDRWLREHMDLPRSEAECTEYDDWKDTLNTETVTLVFAASYLNSPSSMFGHTFIRLDPPQDDEEADLLLANTISYAADAEAHDSEILFAYKGIFGGYPGITAIKPYYEMVRLYSDIEHRDLWEYQLNLTQDEVDMMIAHAWELREINFDYYFFDENCAYRLLALLDVARPGTDLLDEVSTHAIPSDTVRWVVDKDLVGEVKYRPSAATSVTHSLDTLPSDHQTLAAAIANGYVAVDSEEVTRLPDRDQAHLLDATYDYVRYQSEADAWPREHAAPLSHELLSTRSEIQDAPAPAKPSEPDVRDDQGHDTFRFSLAGGRQGNRNFSQVTLRPAYHDVLDPPAGYRPGAQLQFLRLDARYYTDNDELQLEQLVGVEIRSLSPRNQFFSPLSWQVSFGGRRTDTDTNRVFTPYLEGGAGGSWQIGPLQAFALATADLEIDDDFNKGYDAAPGADLGLLHQNNRFSLLAGVKTKAWVVGNQHRQDQLYTKANWHFGRDVSLFGKLNREDHYDRYRTTWQLGLHAYF
ncbi:DUF4105 domain-containing protein [Marinobacter sp.]|uniref:DUF4105 domain-containing protein n=1 Tax=Marinobacter sp. TaxID=50741 RepID=UPI0034A18F21